jgi:hypothetical protein
MTPEGFIAFQVHSIDDVTLEGKQIKWKNIRIMDHDLDESRYSADPDVPEFSYLDQQLTENEIRKGWRFLWDGSTSNGWSGTHGKPFPNDRWTIENGILTVAYKDQSDRDSTGVDIISEHSFANFELSIDFLLSEGSNSGIKYLVDQSDGKAIGPEYQLLDDQNHPDAKLGKNGNRTVGSLHDLIRAESSSSFRGKNFKGINLWNNARIVVNGDLVEHWLNHVKVVEYNRRSQVFNALVEKSKYDSFQNFAQLSEGPFLIQDHGDQVSFKNIKIREF